MNGKPASPSQEAQQLAQPTAEELRVLNEVLDAIRTVQHGTVSLILQDRRVIQIDRTEKRRLVR
jgi:hypothetical protein